MVTLEGLFLPGAKRTRYIQIALLAAWFYRWQKQQDEDLTSEQAWQLMFESTINVFLFGWLAYVFVNVWEVAAGSKSPL